jgi:hypothetical protein
MDDLSFIDEINSKQYEEYSEYKILPEGEHKAEIVKIEIKSYENGNKAFVISLNVEHKGNDYSIINNMWVKYQNNIKAEQIGQGIMKRLYTMLGYPSIPKENLDVIVSRFVGVEIVHTEAISKKTGKNVTYANVKKFIAGDNGSSVNKKEAPKKIETFDEDIEF